MAIPTSRTNQAAEISLNYEKCTNCGLCVSVCKDFSLIMENNKIKINDNPLFGCIGCGHCMAICPTGAVEIHGRTLSPENLFDLPSCGMAANYHQILNLAAESLGLGTCMLGTVHPLIQNGKSAKKFREEHGIKYTSSEGLFVVFGYSAVKYKKGIERTFASVTIK